MSYTYFSAQEAEAASYSERIRWILKSKSDVSFSEEDGFDGGGEEP